MRGYIGRLAAIYVIISVSMILSLFPIYNTIETWQETNISKVLNPECSLCELRQLYLEQGASGFSQYLETRQQESGLKYFLIDKTKINKMAKITWLEMLHKKVSNSINQLSEETAALTLKIQPDIGTKYSLIYLDGLAFAVIEDYLSVSKTKNEVDTSTIIEQVNQSLFYSLLLTGIFITLFLVSTLFLSRKIYRKLNGMSEIAESISLTGDLTQRVPYDHKEDEFDRLAMQLNRAFETIEDKVTDIKNISNTLAHELRTPLTHLSHQIEELEISPEKHSALKENTQHAINVFNSILRICHLESGNALINRTKVDIGQVVKDAVEFFEPIAKNKHQSLTIEKPKCIAKVDKNLFSQAIINLLDNAIKYSPESATIDVSFLEENDNLKVIICNSHTHIDAYELQQLLQRFSRGKNSSSIEGLGLGLSLVGAIAKAHGGQLSVESGDFGFKATFEVVLNW